MAALFARAQTATVTLSQKFQLKDRGLTNSTGTTCRLGNFFYCMEYEYKSRQFALSASLEKIKYGINLYKYTPDMKEVSKNSLNNGKKEFGPFDPQTVVLNNKLLLFYYQVQPDGGIKLFVKTVDPQTLNETEAKELYTISEDNVGLFKMEDAISHNNLALVKSPDEKELVVVQSGNTNEVFTCIINSNNEVVKPMTTVIKDDYQDFKLQDVFLDNKENKCFSYTYTADKLNKRGVLVQNNKGKEAFLDFSTGNTDWESNTLAFHLAKDNKTLYLYANYYGNYLDEGVLLSSLDAEHLTYGKAQLFPYTDDIKQKMHKLGFGSKDDGNYTVKRVDYTCTELEDGTLALTGYPSATSSSTYTSGFTSSPVGGSFPQSYQTVVTSTAGPVINIFLKGSQCKFGLLNRMQANSEASGYIPVAYKNTLVCIYCDSKKNLEAGTDQKIKSSSKAADLVLIQAVISSDGAIISRKVISDAPEGSNYFYLDYNKQLSDKSYLMPIGRQRMNMARYYTEIDQWATVTVQ